MKKIIVQRAEDIRSTSNYVEVMLYVVTNKILCNYNVFIFDKSLERKIIDRYIRRYSPIFYIWIEYCQKKNENFQLMTNLKFHTEPGIEAQY